MVAVARGELGRVWRLPTTAGDLAVKELFSPPTEGEAADDVAFQLLALEAGLVLPRPRLRPDGRVLTPLDGGIMVRAYAWMDLSPVADRPAEALAGVLATLHGIGTRTDATPHEWYTQPVGREAWAQLAEAADAQSAPFAGPLRRALPELIALEAMLPVPPRPDRRRCHLDLDDSNIAFDSEGRLVVIDWENSGPAAPVEELAMLVGDYGPEEGGRLVRAYAAAGGLARITGASDFGMAVAVQGHLISFYARRWLANEDPEGVERSRWRLETALGPALITRVGIDQLLTACGLTRGAG